MHLDTSIDVAPPVTGPGHPHDLMTSALRHLEHQMHQAAPAFLRGRLNRISTNGIDSAADEFLDAIRACVREEVTRAMIEPRPGGAQ